MLNYLEAHPNTGFIAWHSISNVFYIFAKATTQEEAKNFILELCQFIQIVPTSNADVWAAANLPMKDFEDALQCTAALACEADVIVTRNLEDYQQAPIHAMTPTQVLNALQAKQTPSED